MSEKTTKNILVILLGISLLSFVLPYGELGSGGIGEAVNFISQLAGEGSVTTKWSALSYIGVSLGITDNDDVNDIVEQISEPGNTGATIVAVAFLVALAGCITNLALVLVSEKRNSRLIMGIQAVSFLCYQGFRLYVSFAIRALKEDMSDSLGIFGEKTVDVLSKLISYGLGYYLFLLAGIAIFIVLIIDMRGYAGVSSYKEDDEKKVVGFTPPVLTGRIRVLSGKYAGAEITLKDGEKLTVGRDPKKSNLVLEPTIVSGEHVIITFRAAEGRFYLLDKSLNGTFRENPVTKEEQPIEKGVWVKAAPGSIFIISKKGVRLELGLNGD